MSSLESEVIPIATPLITGKDFQLDEVSQRKLAAFLCLISMRLEFLGEMRAIPPNDRLYLREYSVPPAMWTIWITKYVGEKPEDNWSRYTGMQVGSVPTNKVGPEHCNTQVTTMVMGTLCAHLFSSTETPILGYEGVRLTRIWPLSGLGINTRHLPALDDKQVLWLHEAFARESVPITKYKAPT
jgi:hypothetical protein